MKVFYSPNQSVSPDVTLPSPSAAKPALLVDRWLKMFPVQIENFQPVTREDFYLAHQKDFVDDILDNRAANGFGSIEPEVSKTLYWTTGSFYAAALSALTEQKFTCSPSSGFHHAEYGAAGGFCTFNGLMVTVMKILQQFPKCRIGILDCDHHYGNGTDDILKKNLHHNFSFAPIVHYTFGNEPGRYNWKGGSVAENWIRNKLLKTLKENFLNCDLVLYQAGADPHAEDGGALTTEQLRQRDEIVFSYFNIIKTPVVWNLAGGYLQPIERVLQLHDNTMRESLKYQL